MEIIKPGKIRKIKLKCDECGCEFTCNLGELTRIYGTLWAECPQEGCHNVVEVPNGTPEYIAPEKQDNAAGTFAADLPMVTLIEHLEDNGRRYYTVVDKAGAPTNILKALGEPIALKIDEGPTELFYIGDSGALFPIPHIQANSTNRSDTCNGNKEIYRHRKSKG